MRTIKVLAIIGLAVALAGVPVLAAGATAGGVATVGPGGAAVNVFANIAGTPPQACTQAGAAGPPTTPFVATAQCQLGNPAGPLFAFAKQEASFDQQKGLIIKGEGKTLGDNGELKVTVSWKDVKDVKKDETITVTVDKDFTLTGRAEAKVALLKGDKEITAEVEVKGSGEIKLTIKEDAKAGELKLRLTMNIGVVPTLTEWGLIALAVLLAGGMGYMIYRRRPALRPAAP